MSKFNYVNEINSINRQAPQAVNYEALTNVPKALLSGYRTGAQIRKSQLENERMADALERQKTETAIHQQYLNNPQNNRIYEPYLHIAGTDQTVGRSRLATVGAIGGRNQAGSAQPAGRVRTTAMEREWARLENLGYTPQEIIGILHPAGAKFNQEQANRSAFEKELSQQQVRFNAPDQTGQSAEPVTDENDPRVFYASDFTPVDATKPFEELSLVSQAPDVTATPDAQSAAAVFAAMPAEKMSEALMPAQSGSLLSSLAPEQPVAEPLIGTDSTLFTPEPIDLDAFNAAVFGTDGTLTSDQRNARILEGAPETHPFWNQFFQN